MSAGAGAGIDMRGDPRVIEARIAVAKTAQAMLDGRLAEAVGRLMQAVDQLVDIFEART